jgi:hypothetical protein
MVYDKHFVSSPPKDTTSPTSSASSESSEDYIPGRDLLETERYTRFQRELAQRIAGYAPTSGLAPRVALPVAPCVAPRVALPTRISTQAREDEDDYEEGMYPRGAVYQHHTNESQTKKNGKKNIPATHPQYQPKHAIESKFLSETNELAFALKDKGGKNLLLRLQLRIAVARLDVQESLMRNLRLRVVRPGVNS